MPLFGAKKKQVVVAEEHTGATDRKLYDYIDVNAYEREREGQQEHVPAYQQRRQVNDAARKPHWYSLHRKKEPEPTFLEKAGDAAGEQAEIMEK